MTKCVKFRRNYLKSVGLGGNPGLQGRMAAVLSPEFRLCKNIKSRANPDTRCPFSVTNGDYCSRHYKNPRPFVRIPTEIQRTYRRSEHQAAKSVQAFWRRQAPLKRYRVQGPAANCWEVSTNDTELYTLGPISTIPPIYRMSFADERKMIWLFDIRTLVHSMATGFPSQNPYTRDEFTANTKDRIHARIAWLRSRKYHILHINTDVLTADQIWNQAVLDIFLQIEALGYYVSCDWYHQLTTVDHCNFYKKLYDLWEYRLGLTRAEKEKIIPSAHAPFPYEPGSLKKTKGWWDKKNLLLIKSFITLGQGKEQKKLGAMYVLMALVQVNRSAAQALPWIAEAIQ